MGIVAAHGGRIELEPGSPGTCFRIHLPVEKPSDPVALTPSAPVQPAAVIPSVPVQPEAVTPPAAVRPAADGSVRIGR
jgi:hypothetical protein